jgi:hypothetical protein
MATVLYMLPIEALDQEIPTHLHSFPGGTGVLLIGRFA